MIRGVSFTPEEFTPSEGIYKGNLCHGARIRLEDRDSLDTAVLGIEIVSALYKLYPSEFLADKTLSLIGSRKVLDRIREGQDPHAIALAWQDRLEEFRKTRAKYLLY
jgi:uncharacterized protein YbbC (DUF1343 family)